MYRIHSSSCTKHDAQMEYHESQINVLWSKYNRQVGACTLDILNGQRLIDFGSGGLAPGQLYTVTVNGREVGEYLAP